MNLKGLGVAIITPFKEDFSVDFRALTKLINHVIDGGVDYIVSLGTTGESVVLNDQEKISVIEHTINTVEKRVPICLGIGGNDTMAIVDKIKKTNFSNISEILSVSPYYNKPSQERIFLHYKLISESSSVPIILYNVPGRTSSNIEASKLISALKKETSLPVANNMNTDPLTLAYFLNLTDGLCEMSGRRLIYTTNHRDKLDPALIRPGRIDIDLKLDKLSNVDVRNMAIAFYGEKALEGITDEGMPDKILTGAELNNILYSYSLDSKKGIDILRSHVK